MVLVGRDTRRSGPLLEDALARRASPPPAALALRAGVLPTPGVAVLVRLHRADLGAVISASHNPFPDNGIKLFGPDGFKLGGRRGGSGGRAPRGAVRPARPAPAVGESRSLAGGRRARTPTGSSTPIGEQVHRFRILVDCANGAASTVALAPVRAPRRRGRPHGGASPTGVNINEQLRLDPPRRARRARCAAGGYELGLAFDGDADRVLAVDAAGAAVDGDQIIAILARDLHARGALPRGKVVVTSMSNLGFHRAMQRLGIETVVTDVGDRYVLAAMREQHLGLGGEQSGHVIALAHQTTGDGLVTAVLLLAALEHAGASRWPRRAASSSASPRSSSTSAPTAAGSPTRAPSGTRVERENAGARPQRGQGASSCAPRAPSRSSG